MTENRPGKLSMANLAHLPAECVVRLGLEYVHSMVAKLSAAPAPSNQEILGQAIERAASMTYWEHYDSMRRFQRILETLGVDKALREAGVQNGDTVFIGDYELEWQD